MTARITPMGRRAFLRTAAATGLAFRARADKASAGVGPSYRYIDVHTHLGQEWGNRPPLSAVELLAWMDKHEIGKACVMPLVSPESWDHILTTDYVLRETAPHRDRLVPFCALDPRANYHPTFEAKVKHLERYVDAGAKGFGEHKCGVPIDDPRNIEVFAACAELKLPVLFHLDNDRNMDVPGLPGLARVLEAVPNGIFIGHANGWWANISADVTQQQMGEYPGGAVAPGGAIDALMDRFPNLYGDLSAGSGSNAILRDIEFGRAFLVRRADRLLFGTDYLAPGQQVPQLSLYKELDLPGDVRAKIFRENASRLLAL
ncbi:MAG: hypothetical protein AMXMBFR4_06020 [Candidatus Hydrogenedentota bacterium]